MERAVQTAVPVMFHNFRSGLCETYAVFSCNWEYLKKLKKDGDGCGEICGDVRALLLQNSYT